MERSVQLKKELKIWESEFYKTNNRKPNKEDIVGSSVTVQDLYREYNKLRKQTVDDQTPVKVTISKPPPPILNQNDAWGKEFNKKGVAEVNTEKEDSAKKSNKFLKKLNHKMFENSKKFTSPQPSSCISLKRIDTPFPEFQTKFAANESTSIPATEDKDDIKGPVPIKGSAIFQKALEITCKKNPTVSQDSDVMFANKFKPRSRSHSSRPVAMQAEAEWDNRVELVSQQGHLETKSRPPYNEDMENAEISDRCRPRHNNDMTSVNYLKSSPDEDINTDDLNCNDVVKNKIIGENLTEQKVGKMTSREKSKSVGAGALCNVKPVKKRKWGSDDEDGTAGTKAAKKAKRNNGNGEDDGLSQDRRKMGYPEDDCFSQDQDFVDNVPEEVEEKIGKPDPAPAAKKAYRSSKPANTGNFVRLNMKIKSYRRKGGNRMTGPGYKRQQWKQKMKARSESHGNKCFKCGQPGHWANKCTGKMKSNVEEEEDLDTLVAESNFPTISEAAKTAQGIKPSVKKVPSQNAPHPDEYDEDIEASIVRSRPERSARPPPYTPLMQPNADGTLPGLSTLVVLSTGGGKSLCYQLPAYLYAQRSKCITLVISPLVSLMEDQVTGLPPGVRGVCLHTNMTKAQREGVVAAINEGTVHFLLVSPEAVAGGGRSLFGRVSQLPPIAFACIDESHCLSEWSHNFRPSYLRICKVLRETFGVQCFLGLTATATLSTAADVSRHLGISDSEAATIRGCPIPENLQLSTSRDDNRDEALLGLLQGERFSKCDSIIIYCTRREQTERLATLIRTCLKNTKTADATEDMNEKPKTKAKRGKKLQKGGGTLNWGAESYHAGLSAALRKRVQNKFMCGKLRLVVATVAFGMGLDKPDVRAVIHYNMPKSFEGYVQEIGRAGRDGKPAHCHLFLHPERNYNHRTI